MFQIGGITESQCQIMKSGIYIGILLNGLYILDVYHLTTDIKYYNLCEFIFKSWLNEFGDLSNKYNSNQLWDDHTISSRIMSFICFHEFSEKNNLSNIDLSIDTIKHINKNSLLCQ